MHRVITKIYYQDAYQAEAQATVMQVKNDNGKAWVAVDQTNFYPGGGGQLPDKGHINEHPVLQIKEEDGLIWHGLEKNVNINNNDRVILQIDWNWRYYNMQQHSGQHLLSYVLDKMNLPTVSVHLGENYTTVEVNGEIPNSDILNQIEERANILVQNAIPVSIHHLTREQADKLPLRKPAGDWQDLRVVEIDKLDYSACGGTHVRKTSEIGYIKISGLEKIRGNSRIQAHIGRRADQLFKNLYSMEIELKQELQVDADKYIERIRTIKSDLVETKARMNTYRKEFISSTANRILQENKGENRLLFRRDDLSADDVQEITRYLSANLGKIVLGMSGLRFYLMTPQEAEFNTTNFLREKGPNLNMRGGGPPGFAQGVIEKADDKTIEKAFRHF